MTKSSISVSFTYNEDGLRVGKNVNGTVTSYVLHGKNVVHLTQGSNNLHFFYGADGSPAIVEYNGVSYGYVKNLQGDIIAIVNTSGVAVVQYAYDAWGRPLSKSGSMASTLGTLNPIRYRGYVYDEETGLYYLRSRYYNPTWSRFINANIVTDNRCNLSAYCIDNPINLVDSTGFLPKRFTWSDIQDFIMNKWQDACEWL